MNEKNLFNKYVEKMESIDDNYFVNMNHDLLKGHNSYLRMRMKGSSFFNDEWIKKIEDCIYELGQIVNNPLEVTTTEGNVTPIELAKKINYESVQHLASHSQYIKEMDDDGNVVPAKILSQFHKEELHTYENRFIATFIRRLVLFVEKRYEFIRSTVSFDTKDILYIKNKSIVDGQEVSIETKVTVKKENDDTESKIGKEYVERVEKMRTYVNYFYNSPFMKELKTEKDVRKPILQTNIIRKNPLYHKCYETFLFIERFSSLGVEYTLDQNYQAFSEKERKELNYILASHLLSLGVTERSRTYKKAKKTYKPRLLSSIDDEIFTYGDLVKGPISFVRADDSYLQYLQTRADLKKFPKKMNKHEKEFFNEEITFKKESEKEIKNIELLLKRIRREIAKWEKVAIKLIEERNIEEAKEAEAKLEELRKQESSILEKKRAAIIAAALEDKKGVKSANRKTKLAETPVKEEKPAEEKKPAAKKAPAKKHVAKKAEAKITKSKKTTEKKEPSKVASPKPKNIVKKTEVSEAKEEVKVEKPKVEAAPVIEESKVEEKIIEEKKPQEEIKVEQPVQKSETTKKVEKKKSQKKVEKPKKIQEKPAISKKPKKEKAEPKPSKAKEDKNILEVIPGKFIVKTLKGYVVNEKEFSNLKSSAKIFNDFNKARRYKELYGGKVIKL